MRGALARLARHEACQLRHYHVGLSDEAGRQRYAVTRIARLASNENPLGLSPQATGALHASVAISACCARR